MSGAAPTLCACGCGRTPPIAKKNRYDLGHVKGLPVRCLPGHSGRGDGHGANWKGGRIVLKGGYVGVRAPDHPRAHNGYVREHILIVERAMGKQLRADAPVHHVDEVKSNNANENLVACNDKAYHQLLHQRMRALAACGDANALSCMICTSYDRQSDMMVGRSYHGGRRGVHRDCWAEAKKRRRAARRLRGERVT